MEGGKQMIEEKTIKNEYYRKKKLCPYQSKCEEWDDDCIEYCNDNYETCMSHDYYKKLNLKDSHQNP